jgi:hypothetical protein
MHQNLNFPYRRSCGILHITSHLLSPYFFPQIMYVSAVCRLPGELVLATSGVVKLVDCALLNSRRGFLVLYVCVVVGGGAALGEDIYSEVRKKSVGFSGEVHAAVPRYILNPA